MSATVGGTTALGDNAARQLANATKTTPQLSTISPRWLTRSVPPGSQVTQASLLEQGEPR